MTKVIMVKNNKFKKKNQYYLLDDFWSHSHLFTNLHRLSTSPLV